MAKESYRQDKETGKFITKSEWHAKYGPDDIVRADKTSGNGPYIMGDIDPYQSTIDGSMITSRSHHRAHLKQHGCEEIGTENVETAKELFKKPEVDNGVKDAVIDAYNKLATTN